MRVRVVAILAAYNEEKILGRVIRWLAEQGVETYLIDNESTDGTRAVAEGLRGQGLIGMETLARHGDFRLSEQLGVKERLHHELGADWYIHHDADEIRQAPEGFGTLREGLAAVDAAGYNAVDFHEFAFLPTSKADDFEHEGFIEAMQHYCYMGRTTGAKYRINAWKNFGQAIDLASTAGHQVQFEGRKVFPTKFILRHYLALSYAHVLRKYCHRRFSEAEVSRGWFGTRATLRDEEVDFPSEHEMKRLAPGAGWDLSDPWTDEPLFRKAKPPARRGR
ncbi:MAG: glycosyltransferase [Acidobacteria bacterium]|nr:glycosyltransferase [Acidobacteriota bacterium]